MKYVKYIATQAGKEPGREARTEARREPVWSLGRALKEPGREVKALL